MDAERWEQLQDLFEQSLLLEKQQRVLFLKRSCGIDSALVKDVFALIEAHQHTGDMLSLVGNEHLRLAQTEHGKAITGPYQIVERIGGGGMGVVYKAMDLRLERYVALKFLPPSLSDDPQAKRRLLREAKAASSLDHPNICTIFDIREDDQGQTYFAMAYYAGHSLETHLKLGHIEPRKALALMRQLLDGLSAAHAKGIHHRDIKPGNILLTTEGQLKIVDFGVAFSATTNSSDTGIQAGSVAYMSPEQIRGETAGVQADLWAAGVIFYQMLTGTKPFTGDSLPEIVHNVLHTPQYPISHTIDDAPTELNDWLNQALAKDVADRFPDIRAYTAQLRNLDSVVSHWIEQRKMKTGGTIQNNIQQPTPEQNSKARTPTDVLCAIELANYLALNERLADTLFKDIISAYISTLETTIEEYGGAVQSIRQDTFIVRFNQDPSFRENCKAAVNAAIRLQHFVSHLAQLHDTELDCRIAIIRDIASTTPHANESGTEMLNSMLQASAKTDILISTEIQHAVKTDYRCQQYRQLTLITGASVNTWRMLETATERQQQTSVFFGRDSERQQFIEVLKSCAAAGPEISQRSYVNIVTGDHGIGKTFLLQHFADYAAQHGYRTYEARFFDFGTTEDLNPINRIVRNILSDLSETHSRAEQTLVNVATQQCRIDEAQTASLYDLLGLALSKPLQQQLEALHPTDRNRLAIKTTVDILQFQARKTPLLLNICNLHLAKTESIEQLAKLIEDLSTETIVWNLTALENAGKLHRLLNLLPTQTNLLHFNLALLEKSAILAWARHEDIPDAVVTQQLADITTGNPLDFALFFQTVKLGLSTHFEDSIESLINQLPASDKLAIRSASILGPCFTQEALRYLISAPDYKVSTLVAAGLLIPYERYYLFKHALVRDLIYSALNPNTRQNLHSRAAEWYAYIDTGVRADHLQHADDPETASAYYTAAVEQKTMLHLESTLRYCGRGLAVASSPIEIGKFSNLLGETYLDLEKPELALEHYQSSLNLPNTERLKCDALIGLGKCYIQLQHSVEARQYLVDAHRLALENGFEAADKQIAMLTPACV